MQGGMIATTDEQTEPRKFYDMLTTKYGLKAPWHGITSAGIAQTLAVVRSIENAAKKHGPSKLNGELVYSTLMETPLTSAQMFGYTHDLNYNVGAPFPTYQVKVNIGQVQGGKVKNAVVGHPIPKLDRW